MGIVGRPFVLLFPHIDPVYLFVHAGFAVAASHSAN